MNKTIIDALMHRYATKLFDTTKVVSEEDLKTILESARLSASSYGLQPFRVVHVKDKELRAKIRAAAYDQPQVTDAAELLVFAYKHTVDESYIDSYIGNIATTRGLPKEALADFKAMMQGALAPLSAEKIQAWTAKQSYIALGSVLETASLLGVDACPMEGFDSKAVDEILGLTELGLSSAAFVTLGYRSQEDATASYAKVRLAETEFFITR